MLTKTRFAAGLAAVVLFAAAAAPAWASSHREAPFVTEHPKVDGTDFYMFRSYEPGREGFVTLVANYLPLQDAYGGPNYFFLDPEARYRINVDSTGDGRPELSFLFEFNHRLRDISVPVGDQQVSIPLVNAGPITADPASTGNLNVEETYTVRLVRAGAGGGLLRDAADGGTRFVKPIDNIGRKSIPDYVSYAAQYVYDVEIPGCAGGRLFAGQRRESFSISLGEVFDLVNIDNPIGSPHAESDDLADKNVTSLILEVPIACLTGGKGHVIGAWTTAELPRSAVLQRQPTFQRPETTSRSYVQVSRLGMPLVNELVIGLKDKNLFNASRPSGDARFATYVTHPSLPELIEILFGAAGVAAPDNFPRRDLVATFVTGIPGLNELGFGEMLRLNTAVAPTPRGGQSPLGVLGGDLAGFPNGRRPGDDVVDLALRVVMGALCHALPGQFCDPADAPSGLLPFTDGVLQRAVQFDDAFPYLRTPLPGSPD